MSTKGEAYTKIIVNVPPGRLGINLVGTRVTELADGSPLKGKVVLGDHIVSINGVDVSEMKAIGMF